MPNKLPELYLYRLIPGAKQPSRWHIKSRYPVPPAVPSLLAPAPVPVKSVAPSISGPASVGVDYKLTTDRGTWSNIPTSYSYQWFRILQPSEIQPIISQTTASYISTSDDVGFKIFCQVVATNAGGASAPALSNAISVSMPPSDQNLGDDDLLAIDESTAVTNVSFSMNDDDRDDYKSGVNSVMFGFTPKTASPSSVTLNYPSGFFSTYPTPTCTVSVQGTTMTPSAPGNTSITLTVGGTALVANVPVSVTLLGCKMGNSMPATDSITVQTSNDTVPSPTPALTSGIISNSHTAKALVITCIDFRLVDEALAYLTSMALLNEYDEMIVAGACLGYNTSCYNVKLGDNYPRLNSAPTPPDTNPDTNSTLWTDCVDDHISISSALHKFSQLIVIDHLGCGAYNGQFGGTLANPIKIYDELKYHVEQLNAFRNTINTKYKNAPYSITSVILSLMSLNGSVDVNPTHWDVNLSFNLAKNAVVKINGQTGGLPIPTTTMSTPLTYELLNNDMTGIGPIGAYAKINKPDDVSDSWYITNLMSGQDLNSANIVYNLRVTGTNAYIILTMTANGDDTVKFAFSQGTYTAQSGWKVWN